ncbi:MAG: GAF domain-containing protein [Bacteroidales bacterium]|nr:GAF domain-containing protein [Bacteroidales bacterium]
MKSRFHFTVRLKLILGFGILAIIVISIFSWLISNQKENTYSINRNIEVEYPSIQYTKELKDNIVQTYGLIEKLLFYSDTLKNNIRKEISECMREKYDNIEKPLSDFSSNDIWTENVKSQYSKAIDAISILKSNEYELLDLLDEVEPSQFNEIKANFKDSNVSISYKSAITQVDILIDLVNNIFVENNKLLYNNSLQSKNYLVIGLISLIILMIIVEIIMSINLISPINYIRWVIAKISEGVLPNINQENRHDEIGQMTEALNTLVANLKETSQFAIKIGEGDFASEFKPKSKNDVLANSLLVMRDNLIKADKDAEQRKIETDQRNWASRGLAEFNELLRNVGDDMQILSNRVIEKLVRYLEANLGGIYIVNDADSKDIHLELTAFYAFDRLKYQKRRIEIGENLVGQCFRENETVYLTELPKGYVHINSGLGEDDPKCLVIVPLKVNAETYGIVELASFKIIEKYQVEFIEKIGETIASTIANVKINMNTAKLLEESSEKSERLAQQEAEVHKNIENLKAQIESLQEINKNENIKYQKLHDDYENQTETSQATIQKLNEKSEQYNQQAKKLEFILNNSAGYYELDAQGIFLTANHRFLSDVEIAISDIEGKDIRTFMPNEQDVEKFNHLMNHLQEGLVRAQVNNYTFNNKEYHFSEIYTPIRDEYNVLTSVIVISKNITENINHLNDLTRQIAELKSENELLEERLAKSNK